MDTSDEELFSASQQYEANCERFKNAEFKSDADIKHLATESVCSNTKKKALWQPESVRT